jgi:hypothetical protein
MLQVLVLHTHGSPRDQQTSQAPAIGQWDTTGSAGSLQLAGDVSAFLIHQCVIVPDVCCTTYVRSI